MPTGLVHNPIVLHEVSLERRSGAWIALGHSDYVLAIYLAGLSVECVLQALALTDDPTHDAKHDLAKWLIRCRSSIQVAMKAPSVRQDWSLLVRVWRNEIRYLSRGGLLGYLRRFPDARGIRGGLDATMKTMSKRVLDAAAAVHDRGLVG